MGSGEENLKLKATLEGGQQTADGLKQIGDAEDGVGKAADKQAESTKKAKASTEDYVSILNRVHPALGGLVDGLSKGSKIAGEMATRNIDLSGTFKKVTGAVKKNGNALKLIGAGGAVVAGIMAIGAAVRAMREEFAAATKAIEAQRQALNEMKGEERDYKQGIEDLRDTMRQGPFDADQSQGALQTAQAIGERHGAFIDPGAAMQATAYLGGASGQPGGGEYTQNQIARVARLLQVHPEALEFDPRMSAGQVSGRVEGALRRYEPELDKVFGREALQAAEFRGQALQEAQQAGGSTLSLEERFKRRALAGADIDHLVKLAQHFEGNPDWAEEFRGRVDLAQRGSPLHLIGMGMARGAAGLGLTDDPRATATQADLVTVRDVLNEMLNETRRQTATLESSRPGGTVNNYNNSRFIGPSADAQRRARRNGESAARDAERF